MRLRTSYICQQCGYKSSQLLGRCPECSSWNSMVEEVEQVLNQKETKQHKAAEVINLRDVDKTHLTRTSTGIEEFDRVLGGGIVPGSFILVSGEPGIGKSTLLTQLALNLDEKSLDGGVLYVAGEESARQIKLRANRINSLGNIPIIEETDVDVIIQTIKEQKPKYCIIDSVQTIQTSDLTSVAGSIAQVRETSNRLQILAKAQNISIFLVGHINKEGTVAGPKTLEHLVDVVLGMEGDTVSNFRILRASKNRFGPTDEIGIFEMEESGLKQISDASKQFLENRVSAPGSVVVATISGVRPFLVEIQALVTKSFLPIPRRVGTGIDNNRLQLLVAVLTKKLKTQLFDQDIFVNVTGGLKVTEPAADLGICMAVLSSFYDRQIQPKTVFAGEVGLLGEIRPVRSLKKRMTEAQKLGFDNCISSEVASDLAVAQKLALKTSL